MGATLALAIGIVTTAAVYMFLSRDLLRVLLGVVLLGTATNLAILLAGRIGPIAPPLVDPGASALQAAAANPLPQALILTAIVIGFGLTAFALMLVLTGYRRLGTVSAEEMAVADVPDDDQEPSTPAAAAFRRPEREAA